MKKLLTAVLLLCSAISFSQTTNFSFTNKPFSDPELPNYHRGAQYWNGTVWDNGGAPQVPPGTGTTGAKTFYRRYWWVECESNTQGVYKFTKASQPAGNEWRSIEWGLEWCANNGALFSFGGIMTAWDSDGEIFYDGAWSVYPQYLHNQMQTEPLYKDWKTNGYWVPNWNSQYYLDSWRRVNDTLVKFIKNWKYTPSSGPWAGKRVDGWKIIDFVDLRGYGNYGEWHTWPWGANDGGAEPTWGKATDSSLKKIIDIGADVWGDYPLMIPAGVFDDNPWGEGTAFSAYWAMNRKTRYGVISWRRDNIGDPGLDNFLKGNTFTYNGWRADTAILARWKYGSTNGEPLNGCCGTCCPWYYHIRPEINDYHYTGFGNGNYGNNSQQTWDTIQAAFKLTGYRYNLNGGSMTSTLTAGQVFNTTLRWRNVGAAPLYQKRWRVRYELKNSSDQVVQSWVSRLNLYLFLPSTVDSVISENLSLNNNIPPASTYKLTVKIEDTVGFLAPLFLAINSPTRNSDGSYTLRSNITVLAGTLPVTFQSFNAKLKGKGVELNWQTSCDENSDRFEVEKSTDGINFRVLSTVPSVNNCLTYNYTYFDSEILGSTTFYRIKQIDKDGTYVYSTISKVTASRTKNSSFTLYPNPTENNVNVVLDNSQLGPTIISIFSSDGKLVKQQTLSKTGTFINTLIDINDLKVGSYLIKVYVNNVSQGTQQLIKR